MSDPILLEVVTPGRQVFSGRVAEVQFQPLKTLARANFQPVPGALEFTPSLEEALDRAKGMAVAG